MTELAKVLEGNEMTLLLFGDPVMTSAMTDRLTHKSYVVNMNGNSYRMKETKAWLNTLEHQ